MTYFGQKYVVDTNTLSQIGKRRRASGFFRENVSLPEEVLREARDFPDIGTLSKLLYPTTSQVLEWVVQVMATVSIDDTRLVNLFSNKGSADPFLVACALDGQTRDSVFLDAPEWVVVTADEAAQRKAQEFGLTSLSNAKFAALIDAAEDPAHADQFDEQRSENEPGIEIPDDLDINVWDQRGGHRTRAQCGAGCLPEPFEADGGYRIAYLCATHGLHSVVDPFEDEQ